MSEIIYPYNDLFIRYLLGHEKNKDLLLSFINAVNENYDIPIITSVTIKNPFNLNTYSFEKEGIIDVKAKDENGREYNIEVQVAGDESFIHRSLYYWADVYSSQIKKGDDYTVLNPVISINLINFNIIKTKKTHSCFLLMEKNDPDLILTDHIIIHYLELKKFKKLDHFKTKFDKWMAYFKYEGRREEIMETIIQSDEILKKAHQTYNDFNEDEQMLDLLQRRKIWRLDRNTELVIARKKGEKRGEQKKALETAKNMLENGLGIEMICKCTGLSIDEIKKIGN